MEPVIIDVSTWTRFKEVEGYADVHCNGDVGAAIRELVNSGLSHEPRMYL